MTSLEESLVLILEEMSEAQNILSLGSFGAGGCVSFIGHLRKRLEELGQGEIMAMHIIKSLEKISHPDGVSAKAKAVIAYIFKLMDPRDSRYRYGKCDCASCRLFDGTPKTPQEKLALYREWEEEYRKLEGNISPLFN